MAHTTSTVTVGLCLFLAICNVGSCVNKGFGGALNALAPHLANTAASLLTGTPISDPNTPRISLKIVPSKRIHLTPSEMNALLFTIKEEIHRKVNQLEEDLLEHHYGKGKHLSAWALNEAPVYMPFRDSAKAPHTKHEASLQMAVKKMKDRAASKTSAGKPVETGNHTASTTTNQYPIMATP